MQPIAYITVPHSGTHILQPAFGPKSMFRREDFGGIRRMGSTTLHSHARHSKSAEEYFSDRHILFQYRDPRDIIVARHHKWGHRDSWEQVIRWAGDLLCAMEPWLRCADTVLRYEEFILQNPAQMATLTDLLGEKFVSRIRIGVPSDTFRAGRIGDWKTDFPEEYWELYEEVCEPIRSWEWMSRVFVIGNGPSLVKTPLHLLEGELSWAVNQVHLIYPHTTWRPTHMTFAEMTAGGNDWFPKIWEAVKANPQAKKFARDDAWWWTDEMEQYNVTRFNACTHHDIFDNKGNIYYDKVPAKWHFPQICKLGGSIPMTIQLAVQEGAEEIFLLGCDLGQTAGKGNHFDPEYASHRPITETVAYGRNLENLMGHEYALRGSPVPIYNATLGGNLEVYERVEFRSLF